MSPYTASGTFLSRVLDAGGPTTWGTASWTGITQVGTSIDLQVRTGDTPVPDATWTTFVAIPFLALTLGMTGRYLQYQTQLNSSVPADTPILQDVSFGMTERMDFRHPAIERSAERDASGRDDPGDSGSDDE